MGYRLIESFIAIILENGHRAGKYFKLRLLEALPRPMPIMCCLLFATWAGEVDLLGPCCGVRASWI